MPLRNTPTSYGWLARVLHWGTAALMLPTLAIAGYMWTREEDVPGDPQWQRGQIYFSEKNKSVPSCSAGAR